MALTKVAGDILDPGIVVSGVVTATAFDGPFRGGSDSDIIAGIVTATGLDINGNGDISGNLVVGGNLTANGDFTTLNTTLREVELLRVDASDNTVAAGIITQTGSGDLLRLYDGTSQVVTVDDEGNVGLGSVTPKVKLDVVGDFRVDANTTAVAGIITQRGTGDIFSAYDTSTEVFKIADGGDVGIARSIFHLGDTDTSIGFSANDTIRIKTADSTRITIGSSIVATTPITIYNADPELIFRDSNHSPFYYHFKGVGGAFKLFDSVNGDRISFNASGSVSFSGSVVVMPSAQVSNNLGVTGNIILGDAIEHSSDDDTKIRFPAPNIFTVETAGTERLRIHADGEVAIAAAAEGQTVLSCTAAYASSSTVDIQTWARSDSAVKAAMKYNHGTNSMNFGTTTNHPLVFQVNDTERLRIDADGNILLKDAAGQGSSLVHYIRVNDSGGNSQYQLGMVSSGNEDLYLIQSRSANLRFQTNASTRWKITPEGHLLPETAGAVNIGSATTEIGNVYLGDDKRLFFGSDQDFSIKHSGTNAFIDNDTGNLNIQSDTTYISNKSGGSIFAEFTDGGACKLRYAGGVKLATSGIGITVTGEVAASQDYPNFRPTLDLNFAAEKKLDPRITYTRTGPASYVDEFGIVKLVGGNAPRFDHDPTTSESKGLLIEESRTNYQPYSVDMSQGGNNNGVTVTNNQAIAPDGTMSASKITGGTNQSTSQRLGWGTQGVNSSTHTQWSIWVKSEETSCIVQIYSNTYTIGASHMNIELADGTTQGTTPSSTFRFNIEEYPNKWWRISWGGVGNASGNGGGMYVAVVPSMSSTRAANTGSAHSKVWFAWGLQEEVSSTAKYSTSYIPTYGAAATRGVDVTLIDGEEFSEFYNPVESTIVVNYTHPDVVTSSNLGGSARLYRFRAVGGSDTRIDYVSNTNNEPYIASDGTNVANISNGQSTVFGGGANKTAVRVKENSFASSFNGSTAAEDTSGAWNPTNAITEVSLGSSNETNPLNGHIKRFMYYRLGLSNSQLVTLTS